MIKKIILSTSLSVFILTGCSTNTSPQYDGKSEGTELTVELDDGRRIVIVVE